MQAELAKLDPKALEQLPDDLKEQVAQGLTGFRAAPTPDASRLPPVNSIGLGPWNLPGLGGGFNPFGGKKK